MNGEHAAKRVKREPSEEEDDDDDADDSDFVDGSDDEDDDEEDEDDDALSDEGKSMVVDNDAADAEDAEVRQHAAAEEAKFTTKRLSHDLDNPYDAHDLEEEEDDVEEDYDDPYTNSDVALTRYRAGCHAFVHVMVLKSIFPNVQRLLAGDFDKVPPAFVDQSKIVYKTADIFWAEHEAFLEDVRLALNNGAPGSHNALTCLTLFSECKSSNCVQIAAIYHGGKPPLMERCAITEAKFCAEKEEGTKGFLDKTPGYLLIFKKDSMVFRIPVSKSIAVLAHALYYLRNIEYLVRVQVATQLIKYVAAEPGRSYFHYVNMYTADPLCHAADFYYHCTSAKDRICEMLNLVRNPRDAEAI